MQSLTGISLAASRSLVTLDHTATWTAGDVRVGTTHNIQSEVCKRGTIQVTRSMQGMFYSYSLCGRVAKEGIRRA